MKTNVGRMPQTVVCLGIGCLGLLLLSPLSAQESKPRETLKGHTSYVIWVADSAEGRTVAWASLDKTIKLWEVATGKEKATLQGHTGFVFSVAYSPDGRTLASPSHDGTIKLWEVATGKEKATLKGHTG